MKLSKSVIDYYVNLGQEKYLKILEKTIDKIKLL